LVLMMAKGEFKNTDAVTIDFNTSTTDGLIAFDKAMARSMVQFETTFANAVIGIENKFDTRVVSHFADAVADIPAEEKDCLKRVNTIFNQVLTAFNEEKNVPPLVKSMQKLSLEKEAMIEEVKESKNFSSRVFQLIGSADA
ncbi:hypothetical protein BU632_11575, partial [Staphylococcus chromogenes]|uniref:hypothetical protein n=1 Tax=Staphylococcus chromogenes TaxID=46126 RepID=UPI000D48C324